MAKVVEREREGDGVGYFAALVAQQTPFVTWEKNVDQARLRALPSLLRCSQRFEL